MYRMQQGAPDPTLVFLPILLATSASTLVGLLSVALVQRLPLWSPVVLAYLLPVALVLGGFMALLTTLSAAALASLSSLLGNLTLFALVVLFVAIGAWRKVPVYEAFIDGAREGFDVAKGLLPYLVAMLCAVGVFPRLGGAGLCAGRHPLVRGHAGRRCAVCRRATHRPGQAVLGQRGARHAHRNHADPGVDSFAALAAATIQGSTETTFYVLAVYFGAVGIQRARHAVGCALLAELAGVVAAIAVCYQFFG